MAGGPACLGPTPRHLSPAHPVLPARVVVTGDGGGGDGQDGGAGVRLEPGGQQVCFVKLFLLYISFHYSAVDTFCCSSARVC